MQLTIPNSGQFFYTKARRQLLYPTGTIDGHLNHVDRHVDRLKHFLAKVNRHGAILDIGSGLAVADIFIAKIVRPKTIYLLDAASDTDEMGDYKGTNSDAWFSSRLGAETIRDHVDSDVIPLTDLSSIPDNTVDLVVSFRAWGCHFPIAMYEDEVNRLTRPDAFLLVNTPKNDLTTVKNFKEIERYSGMRKLDERMFKKIA